MQDALLSLHAVGATYDPQRPFLPWLFGIVQNRIADGARRYARRTAHEVAAEQGPVTFSDEITNWDEELEIRRRWLRQSECSRPDSARLLRC